MCRVLCMAVLALGMIAAATVSSSLADDSKTPTIKEIMDKAHKGGTSLIQTIGKELKSDSPDWTSLQKQSKELVSLGTSLGKNEPPKGSKESWEKLTKAYVANAKTLYAAAEKMDKEAATAAQKKIMGSCTACHKAHKGQ